jgi:hypothetical protein
MKIDNNRPTVDAAPAAAIEATRTAGTKTTGTGAAARRAGEVGGGAGARVTAAAISAARSTPDVRQDVVARAKALLNDGKVGDDPYRLADALIDKAIDNND